MVLTTAAEQGWSFSSIPTVIELAKNLASDPEALAGLKMKRSSATYKLKHGVARTLTQKTIKAMQAQPFSLNMDEATAANSKKVLTVLVNYMDLTQKRIVTEHLTSIDLVRGDAKTIFAALDEFFKEKEIPWNNLMSILMDSCNVMRGSKAGLETLIRTLRAPHLLDIDGDANHHIHNATKKFCAPFKHWLEGLYTDINNEFQHSTINQDVLREICDILNVKYTAPQNFVQTRWLSVYDLAMSTLVQLRALTVYVFPFLSKKDRRLYRPIYHALIKDVTKAGRDRLLQLGSEHGKRGRTDAGKNRKDRLTDKLFVNRRWTRLLLNFYSACLGDLKRYVLLFQSSECKVHLLHKEQLKLFKNFLGMFLRQEAFYGLDAKALQDVKQLDIKKSTLEPKEMFLGASTEKMLKHSSTHLRKEFHEAATKALTECGIYLQTKLPLNNHVLQAMEFLDPSKLSPASTVTKLVLKDIPSLTKNLFQKKVDAEDVDDNLDMSEDEEVEETKIDEEKRQAYMKEVVALCQDVLLPPIIVRAPGKLTKDDDFDEDSDQSESENQTKDSPSKTISVPVDEWWISLPKTYSHVKEVATALLTCFHGPRVESAFSCMGNILNKKTNRMLVSTMSALQTVRYSLQSSRKSAIDCFKRSDKLYSPINLALCQNMRSSKDKQKEETKKENNKRKKEKIALSIKLTTLETKKAAIAKCEAAEKVARIAHRRNQRAKKNAQLQTLVSMIISYHN